MLLGGDLFHDNKPSRKSLQRAMQILREHCLGDRDVKFEVVSDQSSHFHDKYRTVNYEDPNYNVQLPVFSIHGNHDDPAGDGGLAPLDLLQTVNLVNYFGRAERVDDIKLQPVLIKKGETKLALYGLGHIRDERLSRAFERKEVMVVKPSQDAGEWFNVMAVHQNRFVRGAGHLVKKGYLKEQQLPSCMDVVVWGHEHECEIGSGMHALVDSPEGGFTVVQPGSTVATSLVEGEAKAKHVAILQVIGDQWKLEAKPLKTVRPFMMKSIALADFEDAYDLHNEEQLMDCLEEQVQDIIDRLKLEHPTTPLTDADEIRASYPLVRLKVDYTNYSTCNPQRFGQRFVDKVANPCEILLFHRKARKEATATTEAAPAGRAQKSCPGPGALDRTGRRATTYG